MKGKGGKIKKKVISKKYGYAVGIRNELIHYLAGHPNNSTQLFFLSHSEFYKYK